MTPEIIAWVQKHFASLKISRTVKNNPAGPSYSRNIRVLKSKANPSIFDEPTIQFATFRGGKNPKKKNSITRARFPHDVQEQVCDLILQLQSENKPSKSRPARQPVETWGAVIVPTFEKMRRRYAPQPKKCKHCGQPKANHVEGGHEFEPRPSRVMNLQKPVDRMWASERYAKPVIEAWLKERDPRYVLRRRSMAQTLDFYAFVPISPGEIPLPKIWFEVKFNGDGKSEEQNETVKDMIESGDEVQYCHVTRGRRYIEVAA